MAGVDDRAFRFAARPCGAGADQKAGDQLDRLLRRRQADALQPPAAQRVEPLQRQREMRAALVRRDRVDLVDDDGLRGRQHAAARFGAEQDVERFRRRHEDMRRQAAHAVALGRRRVAGAHPAADLDIGQAPRPQFLADAGERGFEVLAGCRSTAPSAARHRRSASRPAGGDPSMPWRTSASIAARNAASVLPGAGRRRDQHVPSVLDRRPRLCLRRRSARRSCGRTSRRRRGETGERLSRPILGTIQEQDQPGTQ